MFYENSQGFMFGHGFGMIFWMIALVVLMWFLVKSLSSNTVDKREKSAEHILAERYARGEIDDEEYQKRKLVLDKQGI